MELEIGKRYKAANGKEVYLFKEEERLPVGIIVRVFIGVVKDDQDVIWYYQHGTVKRGAPTNDKDYEIVECIDERITEENQQLKELLVTCKYCVSTLMSKGVSDCNGVKLSGLLTKIDNAIGEKK